MEHTLRIRRRCCGASLRQVAELVGVTLVQVHRWEMSKSNPSERQRIAWNTAVRQLEAMSARRVALARET